MVLFQSFLKYGIACIVSHNPQESLPVFVIEIKIPGIGVVAVNGFLDLLIRNAGLLLKDSAAADTVLLRPCFVYKAVRSFKSEKSRKREVYDPGGR